MRLITFYQSGTGSTAPVAMDVNVNPFQIGFGCIVSGTVNYTVQHTFADVWQPNWTATATWFDHADVAAQTANMDGNYDKPVSAIRLTVNSGTGNVTMKLYQAGVKA